MKRKESRLPSIPDLIKRLSIPGYNKVQLSLKNSLIIVSCIISLAQSINISYNLFIQKCNRRVNLRTKRRMAAEKEFAPPEGGRVRQRHGGATVSQFRGRTEREKYEFRTFS